MASSSQRGGGGEFILAATHGRQVKAYDALSGDVVSEFPAANTPRHGLAVAAGAAFVAASHVCPATGAGSVRLLWWWSPASARSLPVSEPVAPLVATPCGSHLLAGGVSGRVHALALPSGDAACSFRAHKFGAVSCLALNDDGSLLVSGGEDGEVVVFPLLRILDVENVDTANNNSNLALYRIGAHVAPVTCVACGHGGCNAVVASASMDGTCKVWNMVDGTHLRTLTLSCTAFSLTLDPTTSHLYAGGSDGCVHIASLNSPDTNTATSAWHASGCTNAAVVGAAMANGCKNLVSCTEDGEVRVWDLASGLLASTFWIGRAVSDVLVVKRFAGDMVRDGGEGFRVHDGEAWRRAIEAVEMGHTLRVSEVDKTRSVELIEMAGAAYKRSLRLMLREVTSVANGRRANGTKADGHVSD